MELSPAVSHGDLCGGPGAAGLGGAGPGRVLKGQWGSVIPSKEGLLPRKEVKSGHKPALVGGEAVTRPSYKCPRGWHKTLQMQ